MYVWRCFMRANPNASPGDGREGGFDIKTSFNPELVVAKVMMAARDPGLDE